MTASQLGKLPLDLVRPDLLNLPGYVGVEPVDVIAERLGVPPERIAKLDGNENPYGPSPNALLALQTFADYHLYPDPDLLRLRTALAEYTGVARESIVCGAGSDELIQLLCAAFVAPGERTIDLTPTFGMYRFETDLAGGESVQVPRSGDFSIDLAALGDAVDEHTKLIFATHPNNPTGNLLAPAELDGLLAFGLPVVVDEAYIEFAGLERSFVGRVAQTPNLIVMRTFSKWAGLAGLRVGYALMAPELAELLFRMRQPYSVGAAAEAGAVAALADRPLLMERVAAIVAERGRMFERLGRVPFLRPHPSEGNFILCDVLRGDALSIRDRLRGFGVFVRHFDRPGLRNCLRISVGLPRHTDQLIAALEAIGVDIDQ
jgi:histidinol-phosphate aminotransferase